ncbi:MAG: orotidine-5'-phosphate decarboxylase [Fimbriimonadaceae bacterium]|nr:orotidine-5'-phosphate decarboxylase [Fimbriimonadaceae bacterium]
MRHKIICALDTGDLDEALSTVKRLKQFCGAFKIGHGLTLPHGLDVIDRLRDAGAERVFLDLKFHDIPNSVAIGVREAAKRGVWMLTIHLSGGPAMVTAAVEEARAHAIDEAPILVGVSVLTSLNEHDLHDYLGTPRSVIEHMSVLSGMGVNCGLDGVVCSVHEAREIRAHIGHGVIVTPGIRPAHGETNDQRRVGDGRAAIEAGADYMVIGRALTSHSDPVRALAELGLDVAPV